MTACIRRRISLLMKAYVAMTLFMAVFTGCGGDGSDHGGTTAPTISNLLYSPTQVPLESSGGTATVTGTIDFSRVNGVLATCMVEIYDSGDHLLTTGSYTLSDVPDGSSGTIAFSATVPTDTAGRFSFKIFVTDTSGRDSNSLSGDFDVTMGVLETITLSPAAASVPLGSTQQLILEGTLSDNTPADPSYFSTCTFVSSATDKATVDANGLVTPNAVGQATITATCGPLSAMSDITLTVNPAQEAGGLVYIWPFNQSNWYAYGIQGDGRLAVMPASPMQNDGALGGDRVVTDHSGSYAFTEYGTGIYASRIDRSAGTLTPLTGSPFTIPGDEPNGLWAHPTQPWMYAVSWQDWIGNTIRAYDITGEDFTTSDPGTDVGSNYAVAQAFTPDGAYFYMIGQDSNTIPYTFALLSFQVEPTNGQLTEILPRKSDVKFGMVVSPDGNHLYAGNNWNAVTDPGAIHHFSLDSMTGQLTLEESTPFAGQAMVMAFDPVDPLLYVLARDASFQAVLFVFEIDSMTGELIQLGVTNLDPQFNINRMDMRVAPHGGMLYAAAELFSSGNKVALVFSVNGTTGGVTELQRLTVTNGGYQPTILVIPPLPVE